MTGTVTGAAGVVFTTTPALMTSRLDARLTDLVRLVGSLTQCVLLL